MRKIMIETTEYEPGDVLDVSKTVFRYQGGGENNSSHSIKAKARSGSSNRLLVLSTTSTKSGTLYKGVLSNGKAIALKPYELGQETYIGHLDLGILYENISKQ